MGRKAQVVALGHNAILDMVVEKAIREQRTQGAGDLALRVALPVLGSSLFLFLIALIRRKRRRAKRRAV
jgi:hypothetical protein